MLKVPVATTVPAAPVRKHAAYATTTPSTPPHKPAAFVPSAPVKKKTGGSASSVAETGMVMTPEQMQFTMQLAMRMAAEMSKAM
jgi:hypothetical protein